MVRMAFIRVSLNNFDDFFNLFNAAKVNQTTLFLKE